MNTGITKSVITVKGIANFSDEEKEIRVDEYNSSLMLLNDDKTLMNIEKDGAVFLVSYIKQYVASNYVTRMIVKSVTGLSLEETLNPFAVKDTWYVEQVMDGEKEHTNLTILNTTIQGWESSFIGAILFNHKYEDVPIYVEIYMESN